jgi:hypothetical protein
MTKGEERGGEERRAGGGEHEVEKRESFRVVW